MDFSIDVTELRQDMMTIQKYSNELIEALKQTGLNTVSIVSFETLIKSAISQLKYYKQVNEVLMNDKDQNVRRINDLLEKQRQLEIINFNNGAVIDKLNSLFSKYNTNDLTELIDLINNEHTLLDTLKTKVADLPKIEALTREITSLKVQLQNEKDKRHQDKDKSSLMYVATAATGAGVTFMLNKIFERRDAKKDKLK